MFVAKGQAPERTDPSARRWGLWATLVLLVLALLVVLVFLAREYEEARDQQALEQEAAAVVSDIRNAFLRNVQTLQSLNSVSPTADSWNAPAAELIDQAHMVHLWSPPAGLALPLWLRVVARHGRVVAWFGAMPKRWFNEAP